MTRTGNKFCLPCVAAIGVLSVTIATAQAADVVLPNTFQAGQPAIANEVNDNFTTLADAINGDRLEAFYGDASEGDLDLPGLQAFVPVESTQFADCTVQAGHIATIFSGTVIRCRGDFINDGTLNVQNYTQGGGSSTTSNRYRPAHPGAGQSAAMRPGAELGSSFAHAAFGGQGMQSPHAAAHRLRPGPVGGGSGSAGRATGGAGGGTLTIITAGRFINNGTIDASGGEGNATGAGGGGGGIVTIAAAVSYQNTGTIDVSGGDGREPNITASGQPVGPGGGGGGGLIRVVSPQVFGGGITLSSGGLAGDISGGTVLANSALISSGGGGGGGCYGSGGAGGNVDGGSVSAAVNGTNGAFFATDADPAAYF